MGYGHENGKITTGEIGQKNVSHLTIHILRCGLGNYERCFHLLINADLLSLFQICPEDGRAVSPEVLACLPRFDYAWAPPSKPTKTWDTMIKHPL